MWVPIVGWSVGSLLYDHRVRPFVNQIRTQLRSRSAFPADAWGDEEARLKFARSLCATIKEEIGWPNDHFHPDDPVRLACWGYRDGLDTNFLQMEIEEKIGTQLTDAECETLTNMTLGAAVDCLLAKKTSTAASD